MNHLSGAHSRRRKTTSYSRQSHWYPSSPLQHWKLEEDHHNVIGGPEASARKLAAGLWQLRFTEISRRIELNSGSDDHFRAQLKNESTLACAKSVLERAAKWDPCCLSECDKVHGVHVNDCPLTAVSMVLALSDKLMQARLCIRELETKRKSFRKKVKRFLRKFEEERVSRKCGYHYRDCAVLKDLKRKLSKERRSRQRVENLSTNLVSQLADAKLSADRYMKTYEEEKTTRNYMEHVCGELAEYIRENKAELKALKRESNEIIEELDGERKMLQMAEAWREERVQMKLVDAKRALEDKYNQVNNLITDIEAFLRSRFSTLDMPDLRKAELILQEVKSLNIQDIEDFCEISLKSDDVVSTYEGTWEAIKPYVSHSSASGHGSKLHPVSPDNNWFNKSTSQSYSYGLNGYSSGVQVRARGWANGSHGEDHSSCHSLRGLNSSNVGVSRCRRGSSSVSECKESAGRSSSDTETCSVLEQQSEQKPPTMSEIWRSCRSNGDISKIVLDKDNKRLPNGVTSCLQRNADSRLIEHESRRQEHPHPPYIANPHITRGMQGRIQWPRAVQKNNSNAKLLEAKIESQRSQLRHIFKQRFM